MRVRVSPRPFFILKVLKLRSLKTILNPIDNDLNCFDSSLIESLNTNNNFINELSNQIIKSGGKRIRPAIAFLVSKNLDNNSPKINNIAKAIELIHTATLIHDDIIDEASTRRGVETTNKLFGSKIAVVMGDFFLSTALKELAAVENPQIISIFSDYMKEVCEGEIQQTSSQGEFLSIDEYLEKSKRKTALLFAASAQSAAIISTENKSLIKAVTEFALNLGIAFQITDDILNFTTCKKDKPKGNDILSGIYTAPIIYAVEYHQDKLKKLLNVESEELKLNKIIELINEAEGIEKSKKLAVDYAQKAYSSIDLLPLNDYNKSLKNLIDYILQRDY